MFGLYEPDGIAAYRAGGHTWLMSANEGDEREWGAYKEGARVKSFNLDPTAFPDPAVKTDPQLGRLTVSTVNGDTDHDGDYDQLYVFGGRSLSVLDAGAHLSFDTGSQLETLSGALDPTNFNKDETAASPIDDRSDNKGPEPEGIDIGVVRGHKYAFAGTERLGGVFAYDIGATPGSAAFAGYVNTRPADLGPEGVHFISAEHSPTGKPLLLTANEVTGTVR